MSAHGSTSGSRYATLRLAHRLRQALKHAQNPNTTGITLDALVRLHGQASIATLLLLYAVFCLMPVGGVGNVFGIALWLLSWQWARGYAHMTLPQRVAAMRLNARWSRVILRGLSTGFRSAARWLRPRWPGIQADWTQAFWGAWIALQALVIFLPVPLGNTLPALSLIALALGRMLADGWMHATSLVLGGLGLIYIYLLGQVTWDLSIQSWQYISGLLT
jgi:hypothetical protein